MDELTKDPLVFRSAGSPDLPCFLSACGQSTFRLTFGAEPGPLELVHAGSRPLQAEPCGGGCRAALSAAQIEVRAGQGGICILRCGQPVCTLSIPRLTLKEDLTWHWRGGTVSYERKVSSASSWDCFPHITVTNLEPSPAPPTREAAFTLTFPQPTALHGLGQHEKGIFDYRSTHQYLYHTLMKTPMPFLAFGNGCGLLIDCGCLLEFESSDNEVTFRLDSVDRLELFFLITSSMDELVRELRRLTGHATMLPRWALGYLFSKERFRTQEELLRTARLFRQKGIPCDCLVQDWRSWVEPLWGDKHFDTDRFPSMKEAVNTLHSQNFRYMVAVWPNAFVGAADHQEMERAGFLLGDYLTYDAFDPAARDLYYSQCREYEEAGADALWADASEPFQDFEPSQGTLLDDKTRSEAIGGAHKRLLGSRRANLYSLYHCRGLYEHWTARHPGKRPVFLTRSVYPSEQSCGVIHWSGDISATWQAYRDQLAELLNMNLCGIPYLAEDIGGFAVRRKDPPMWSWAGDFQQGVDDLGYRELYVRWMQNGALLPIFRSHGTDTPREPWYFADTGEVPFYQAILGAIRLRYQLLPALYTLMADTVQRDESMMRALCFDYPGDARAAAMSTEYLLGHSLLVCPVLKPFYYGPNSRKLAEKPVWPCYLPEGDDFYDWHTGLLYRGGQTVAVEAPIDRSPLFVKAGSLLTLAAQPLQSTADLSYEELDVEIYPGRDAACELYQDEGDGDGWQRGQFCRISFRWQDTPRRLTISARQGRFPGMPEQQRFHLHLHSPDGGCQTVTVPYCGEETILSF